MQRPFNLNTTEAAESTLEYWNKGMQHQEGNFGLLDVVT